MMSLFGEHLSVARAVAGSFYCATVLGVYACAIALVDQKRAALCGLSLLSVKFFAFPIYTMFFYADPSVATAILALARMPPVVRTNMPPSEWPGTRSCVLPGRG